MKQISIIGSGTMGFSILELLLDFEFDQISLIYRNEESFKNHQKHFQNKIQLLVDKGKKNDTALDKLTKVNFSNNFNSLKKSDLVIEAISENLEAKKELYNCIKDYLSTDVLVTSNTSSLSITSLANLVPNNKNFAGLHFFNPAPIMELIEIIRGFETSDDTMKRLFTFAEHLKKKPVLLNEGPGFVVNRMLIPMINEAIAILSEGVANKEDIDKAMMYGAHHPMGPLRLSDFIGNDVVLSIMNTIHEETGDPKYRAHSLLRKMVRANKLGRKTRQGFYSY